jgi:signal transduction histidine kinase
MEIYRKTLTLIHLTILTGTIYDIYVLIISSIRKRQGAILFLIGFFIFALTIANDILIGMGILFTPYLVSFGLIIFVLFQAAILSQRFARAFETAEELSMQLEKKVKDRTHNLEIAKREAENAKAEIEKIAESRKKLSIIGQMAAGIVHDLKNPISTIKVYAEMANTDTITREDREEFLRIIIREIDRLGNLAYEILDFSKNQIYLDLEDVNISEFLNELYEFLKVDFEYANIGLNFITNYTGTFRMDRERMRRVLINMSNNARESMQDGKKGYQFSIEVNLEDGCLLFALTDNGHGISESIVENLFDAFHTKGKTKGTGLGLFMCKNIVEAHKGQLSYTTEIGKGTTFYIKLR